MSNDIEFPLETNSDIVFSLNRMFIEFSIKWPDCFDHHDKNSFLKTWAKLSTEDGIKENHINSTTDYCIKYRANERRLNLEVTHVY